MWKWVSRLVAIGFVLVALPCIAFTGAFFWGLQPMTNIGQSIGDLTDYEQVAYLIIVDQMRTNEMLAPWRENGGNLSVGIDSQEDECGGPGAALHDALVKSTAFKNISLSLADCSDDHEGDVLYVSPGLGVMHGGYLCGALCGRGSQYLVLRPLGFLMVIRMFSFVN